VKKIDIIADVKARLAAQGFGGLYNTDGPCGCCIDDLAPCGECNVELQGAETSAPEAEDWINGCEAGHKHVDPRSKLGDWVVSGSKELPTPDEFDSAFANC
jgi:hypothetical protein